MNYDVIKSANRVRLTWMIQGAKKKHAYYEPTIEGLEKLKKKLRKIKDDAIVAPTPTLYLQVYGRWTRFCPAAWGDEFINGFIQSLRLGGKKK